MFIHILRYRIYSTSVKIKVQLKLTDNSLASETKHKLFAGSSSIVLEGYQRHQVKVGFLNPSYIFNSLLLRHFNLSGCEFVTFLINVASFLSIVETVAAHPNESRSLQTQYLAPASLSRLNLYSKF